MHHKTSSKKTIISAIENSIKLKQAILDNNEMIDMIAKIANEIEAALRNNHKILFCGNGGSAADAQHLSAELSGRFYLDRDPLFAEALHVNTSYLTAVANDYSFEEIYSRALRAMGKEGDVLVAISTSGKSKNIIKALKTAKDLKVITIGFTGKDGNLMNGLCKYLIKIPSNETPRIQEAHLLIGHIICEIVERNIYG